MQQDQPSPDFDLLCDEVDRNYAVFQKLLPQLLIKQRGKVALMRGGEIVAVANDIATAEAEGIRLFKDGIFSVQPITDEVVELGSRAHAVPNIQI